MADRAGSPAALVIPGIPLYWLCVISCLTASPQSVGVTRTDSNREAMNPADTVAAAQARRVVTVSAEVVGADPMDFLRRARGRARGFWARADHWMAHAGSLATLAANGTAPEGRFGEVQSRARDLFDFSNGDSGHLPAPRFYGGFSFRSDHSPEGLWSGFPPALFHLPEVELAKTSGQPPRLIARALVDPEDGDVDGALARLLARTLRLGSILPDALHPRNAPPTTVPVTRHESKRSEWQAAVEHALTAIEGGAISKVVLARTLDVVAERRLDPIEVVEHLWGANRGSHVFLFEPEEGRALVGAAPETITTVSRGSFHATAVAGTVARGETPEEQRGFADRLLASEKDATEHRIALQDMVARLDSVAYDVTAQAEPHVLTLARIQHLETDIRARLTEGTSALSVLEALHPTPAVCGLPRDAALEFLEREEPFERGWYAGPVGWFDVEGNGVLAPALRCAVVQDRRWRLFAGAGIVAGSDPSLEWEETTMKFEPVLRALAESGAR